jgi:SNF2 family DNA or RNA helicase
LSRNGAILGDDMGLGKSMQSIIAALESAKKNTSSLPIIN